MELRSYSRFQNGDEARELVLENANGMRVHLIETGAVIRKLIVPDKNGDPVDVVLGFDSAPEYEANAAYSIGANVGRVANRIENARFTLNGTEYRLTPWKTPGKPSLHSLPDGYSLRRFHMEGVTESEGESGVFTLHSPHMDQGFPGALDLKITITLNDRNEIRITYDAVADRDTLFAMTNHSYFNLNGHDSGDALSHRLMIESRRIPFYGRNLCPVGGLRDIADTPYDFREEKTVGRDIFGDEPELKKQYGYDVAYEVNGGRHIGEAATCAALTGDRTGIRMEVDTDMPSVQLYTANRFQKGFTGKDGAVYGDYQAVCLEPGYFANSINAPGFEPPVLKADTPSAYRITYRFGISG